MTPAENIKKLFKKLHTSATAQLDKKIYDEISRKVAQTENKKSPTIQPNIWKTTIESRITQLVATAIVVLAICLFAITNSDNSQQQPANVSTVTATSKTPAELMSYISLRMAFRDGDMEAVEEQCRQADKLLKSGSERLTVEQLLGEL